MAQREGPSDDASAGQKRPSLIERAASTAPTPAPSLSVLAALDGRAPQPAGRAPKSAMPWLLGLGGLAVAAVFTGWMLRGTPPSAAAPERVAAAAPAPATTPAPAAVEPAASAAIVAAAPASATPAMAAVEELPAAAAAAAAASPLAVLAAAPDAAPKATAEKNAERTKARPAREKARTKDTKDTRVAKARTEPKARPAVATAKAAAAAPAAVASTGDADVDLIAALVQHMDRDASAAKGDLTIADLVGRCKSLAGSEAQRCMRRICENYWGRAEACPRSAAPSEVAVRP